MNYTGERMQPIDSDPNTFWEHIYRYAFAARFAAGRQILDVACGAGYGTAALRAAGARSVVGVDNSLEACQFAATEFSVNVQVADAQKLPFADGTFDLIVSFETIEHLDRPLQFLDECRRVLSRDGTLVLSTPHKTNYRKITPHNPFHAHELEEEEFEHECRQRFSHVDMFTQHPFYAPWWSPRGLAAMFWPGLRFPKMIGMRRRLVETLYPHLTAAGLEVARARPVETILTLRSESRLLANPYALRKRTGITLDQPLYLIAVCSTNRGWATTPRAR